jgi:hypothetical protein
VRPLVWSEHACATSGSRPFGFPTRPGRQGSADLDPGLPAYRRGYIDRWVASALAPQTEPHTHGFARPLPAGEPSGPPKPATEPPRNCRRRHATAQISSDPARIADLGKRPRVDDGERPLA